MVKEIVHVGGAVSTLSGWMFRRPGRWTRNMLLAPLVVVTAASQKFYSLKIICSRISCIQTPVLLPKC